MLEAIAVEGDPGIPTGTSPGVRSRTRAFTSRTVPAGWMRMENTMRKLAASVFLYAFGCKPYKP